MNCDVLGRSSLPNKNTYPQIKDQIVNDIKVSPIDKFHLKTYKSGMRFFRNFPEFRNFQDLRGHSRGNRRSDLIFMGGGGGTIYSVCSLSVSNAGTARHKSSQA